MKMSQSVLGRPQKSTIHWGLKQQTFSSSGGQKSEIKVSVGPFLQKPLRENPSCLFQILVVTGIPWLVATSLQSVPPCPRGFLMCLCLCFLFSQWHHHIALGPT